MQVWNVLHTARWNTGCKKFADGEPRAAHFSKNSPFAHHLTTLTGHIFATKAHIDIRKKNWLNNIIFSTCPYNMVNFGSLTAEIGCRVWGIPANFNGFRVLTSLLHRSRSMEVNQTLHDVWSSSVLVHYTLCSKKTDAKIQITITVAYLIQIKYPFSGFNYHLSVVNFANFNKIHRILSEQQLFK